MEKGEILNWNEFDNIKILIAEDDIFNREFLVSMFIEYENFEILEAQDGQEAYEKILKYPLDVILLDVHMPKKNGLEIVKDMRKMEKFTSVPVIVITSDKHDKTKALEYGANDFLPKPYDTMELKVRVYNQVKLRKYSQKLEEQVAIKTQQLRAKMSKIEETQRKLLLRIALFSEKQMTDKSSHKVEKIAIYTKYLSQMCGLSADKQEDIYYSSALHNIGFFALPNEIRTKKGQYNARERAEMQKHIGYGSKFLSGLEETDLVRIAKPIISQYSENWDGSGYPKGLKGDEISIYARIVTVCVHFNALTTPRDYREKKVLSDKEVYSSMKSESGITFDPILLNVFLKNFKKFIQIKDKLIKKVSN